MNNICIDLAQEERGLVPVEISWPFKMPEPKQPGFFQKLFKSNKPETHSIPLIVVVDDVKARHIKCNLDELFAISYGREDKYCIERPLRVEMSSNDMPFTLKFNTAAIQDCDDLSQSLSVTAKLLVFDGNKLYGDNISFQDLQGFAVEQSLKIKIDVEIKRPEIKPELLIDLDDDLIQYSRKEPLKNIGQLRVKANVNFSFIPEMDLNLHFALFGPNKKQINDAIVLGPRMEERGLLFVQDISLDMNKLSNPRQDEEYEIECSGSYSIKDGSNTHSLLSPKYESFTLKRDMQGAELAVFIDNQNLLASKKSNNRMMLKQINFTLGSQLMRRYKMVFQNLSSDDSIPTAGVEVTDLMLNVKTKGAKLFNKNGIDITDQVMNISGQQLSAFRSEHGLFLPNGIGEKSHATLSLTFNPQDIARIEWECPDFFLFSIICNIDFQYVENRDGVSSELLEKKSFHATLEQRVYLEPNPEWLCVDYGTSAIVSVYNGDLLGLHTQKTRLINSDIQYRQFSDDEFEKDSNNFLSSDILLHEIAPQEESDGISLDSSLSSEQKTPVSYSHLAVCLSPTSSMIKNQFVYQLPCLKMLVGRDLLPANPNYNIQYYHKTPNGVERVHANDIPVEDSASLQSVINVFRESYHSLFRYFILPEVKDLEHLNKLALTYPNTYTPMHLSMIRQVVRQVLPSIRMDQNCLRFVSESDAVAAYYMRHWGEYHSADSDIDRDENILVYDMGAGTLDVSLLQKRSCDGHHELRIIGKLGTCKAGNYLDYVIAQIICNQLQLNPLIISTEDPQMEIRNSISLKLSIKSQIKPQLSIVTGEADNNDEIEFEIGSKKYSISRNDIITHQDFIDYLEETTSQMLHRMCRYMDCDKLSIDTVLMSGRSCRLMPLQNRFQEAVNAINSQSHCDFIALDTPVNGDSTCSDRQKTAVVEGAIAIADIFSQPESPVSIQSKRLYANFGVAYQGIQNQWNYIELLNHKDIPTSSSREEYQFEMKTIQGVGVSPKLCLIQSYLNAKETEERLNQNDLEYISVMGVFSKSNYKSELRNGDELDVCIVLTELDEVALCIGQMQSIGRPPKGTDLESEVAKRSFWPVRLTY
jgi:hypothetical protein